MLLIFKSMLLLFLSMLFFFGNMLSLENICLLCQAPLLEKEFFVAMSVNDGTTIEINCKLFMYAYVFQKSELEANLQLE